MSGLHLTSAQRRRLEQQLRATRDVGLYRRTLAILEAASGRSVAEIARLLRTSRVAVYRWIGCYDRARDPICLVDHRGGNRPSLWTEEFQAALRFCLGQGPDHFGYQAVKWTVPLLQEHLENWGGERPSATSIRRQLHAPGYVWKRPRYVLDSDPEHIHHQFRLCEDDHHGNNFNPQFGVHQAWRARQGAAAQHALCATLCPFPRLEPPEAVPS